MKPAPERTTSLSFLAASLVIATLSLSIVGAFSAQPVSASPLASAVIANEDLAEEDVVAVTTTNVVAVAPSSSTSTSSTSTSSTSTSSTSTSTTVALAASKTTPTTAAATTLPAIAAADGHKHEGRAQLDVEADSETEVPQDRSLSVPEPTQAIEKCTIPIAAESTLRSATSNALNALNAELVHVRLVLATSGTVTIGFGGEWPADVAALGWTDPSKRSILINPNHPGSTMEPALAEVIAHELGHVLIGAAHVSDGTILDPSLDGQIRIGDADRDALGSCTCETLGF